MPHGHHQNSGLAILTQFTGVHLDVQAPTWAFECVRDLPLLEDLSLQFTGTRQTAQLLAQQQHLTQLCLKCEEPATPVAQVSTYKQHLSQLSLKSEYQAAPVP